MNPKEKTWLKSCIDYLLKMHGGGESIRMINVAFMPERPAGVFPDDEKAKQALFSEIARVAEEGKLLKPQPIGDIWHRPGKPPLVMKVESSAGMARLSMLVEGVPEQHQLKIAISTLKMPDAMVGVMGGPNKEQARDILRKNGWSDARIAALEETELRRPGFKTEGAVGSLVSFSDRGKELEGKIVGENDFYYKVKDADGNIHQVDKSKADIIPRYASGKKESRLSRVVEKEYEFQMGDPVRIVGNVDGKGKSGKVDYSKNGFAVVVDKNGKGIGSFHWSDLKLKSEEGAWPLMSEPSR